MKTDFFDKVQIKSPDKDESPKPPQKWIFME